jgi:hypothetical protein
MTAINNWLTRPTSIVPLVFFRVAFGLLMLVGTIRFISKGWIAEFYVKPQFHFTYYGFGWIKPLPGNWMYAIFIMIAGLCICIVLGAAYRFSMTLFFLMFTSVELIDKTYYLNHYYFISVLSFLLIFLPLHRCYSLDARLHPMLRTDTVAQWTLWAIRLQLAIVYCFAGIAKLNSDWLFRALPLRIWLPANADLPVIGPLFDHTWVAFATSWAGAAYDLTIPFWLVWRRSRPFAYVAVIGFHILTAQLFYIGMFPWIMIVSTLIFFTAEDYRSVSAFIRWQAKGQQKPAHLLQPSPEVSLQTGTPSGKHVHALTAGFIVFFAIQCLMPLRHYLYPGDVLWTEEGYRFSWRVMLVEKAAYATFFVTDPVNGQRWMVSPSRYLTPQQVQQMSFQPDMILQFAHYLAEQFRRQGYVNIEVRAEVYVSWNRRPSRLLIDPTVDLAGKENSWRPKAWILRDGESSNLWQLTYPTFSP